ncbi:MAG TPA: hypothetical protein VIM98_06640 [Dyella sp.]|uniref:hypothetical protein n=1 Tax=Dyella sp. TaxID=1869338 RepID=UPI002F95152C
MKRFALAAFVLATAGVILVAVMIGLSPSTFLAAWIMGSRQVTTIRYIETHGTRIVATGPTKNEGGDVVVPVDVLGEGDSLIGRKYRKVSGMLRVAPTFVYVDAGLGVSERGWPTWLPWHYGTRLVLVRFTDDEDFALQKLYHIRSESSGTQALSAAHAPPAPPSLDTEASLRKAVLLARPGDSLLQFQSQFSPAVAPDPAIKYELGRTELGVRLFLTSEAKVKIVRLDWPYTGTVGGIKIGDSLDEVRRTLGEQGTVRRDERQEVHPNSVYFDRVAGSGAQVDLDDAHRIVTIILR